ncbi:Ppx/GppA phosphatase family protein [Clostridium sp.]|uniref:Ppx/GppA phosphatase family protein n=1 Tax=Clostridium sp. TaxID=1506 RepID=UPI00262E5960|nr:Ppx/GppA phosphatase family protein [Clostridium sp.]
MNKIGVIDFGPSSIRLMLSEIDDSGYFKVIDELKTPIRLCHDLINGNICRENTDIILSTLAAYKSMCTVTNTSNIIAVATESLREAKNKDLLLPLIKKQLDIDIRILSKEEEIYYNFLGIQKSIYVENALIVEVAGTDTHLAWVQGNKIIEQFTLPIGSVNLSYKYNLIDRILSKDLEEAFSLIKNNLSGIDWLYNNKFDYVIAIASTSRNLAKLDRVKKRYPFDIPHNYEMSDLDVNEVYNLLKSKDLKQRQKLAGIEPEFSDIIVGGTAIFKSIVNAISCSKIKVSGRALREGLIYEYLEKNFSITTDILDYSLDGILNTLNGDKNHAFNVFKTSLNLFNDLKPLHHLDDSYLNIIKTASMLHDCGISINYYGHHKHSFYIILNSHINGLSHKELLMSALIASSHRFNSYQTSLVPFSAIINQLDLKVINQISILVKIAEGLDRSLVGAVKKIETFIEEDTVRILVFSDINVDFEVRQALRGIDKFKEIYGRNLIIESTYLN